MDAFLSLKRPGIANKPPPFVTCSLSSGGSCGARGLFPHHPLILMWFYSPALLLSACLWPSVSRLEMYKVKLRGYPTSAGCTNSLSTASTELRAHFFLLKLLDPTG